MPEVSCWTRQTRNLRRGVARIPTRLVETTLVGAIVVGTIGLLAGQQAMAQEFPPGDQPPTGRILRWIDNNPPGSVDHWEWRAVTAPESPWSPIHGPTQLELNGIWYGIAFPNVGILDVEIRAVGITGDTTVIVSAPSNPVRVPNCFDADLNRDGLVGGPDWTQFALQWNQTCVVSN